MNNKDKYYQLSGNFTGLGLGLASLLILIVTVVLSVGYAYAIYYAPYDLLKIFATVGCFFALSVVIIYLCELFKIQNIKIMIALAIFFGLLIEYFSWVVWIYLLSEEKHIILLNPADIYQLMKIIAVDGVWSLGGRTVCGLELYIYWLLEFVALTIIPATLIKNIRQMVFGNKPFCEQCNKWIKTTHTVKYLYGIEDYNQLQEELESGDFEELELCEIIPMVVINEEFPPYLMLELKMCKACKQNCYLSIKHAYYDDENSKYSYTPMIKNLIITKERYDSLKAEWQTASK